jgi:ribose 5-phosphate isomerase B
MSASLVREALTDALERLIEHEDELAQLDSVAGDGDHGAGMVRGFRAAVAAAQAAGPDGADVLAAASAALADAAGGASGALWGVLLSTLAASLRESDPHDEAQKVARGLRAGLEALATVGKAEPGDKTMLDALAPFVAAFEENVGLGLAGAWQAALPAALAGRDETARLIARRGRAAALGEKSRGGIDPGAQSLCLVLEAVAERLTEEPEPAGRLHGWRLGIGSDGAGLELKEGLRKLLAEHGRVASVIDFGVGDDASTVPYPEIGVTVAEAVARGEIDRAVLVCGTGIGMAISANKVPGVRATVAYDPYSVERSVLSNNCQVLALGSRVIALPLAAHIVDEWLSYEFDPKSASAAKVAAISDYERSHTPARLEPAPEAGLRRVAQGEGEHAQDERSDVAS